MLKSCRGKFAVCPRCEEGYPAADGQICRACQGGLIYVESGDEKEVEKASQRGILIVRIIKEELDKRLGRNTALVSTYNLLHRHGWRKLASDKNHPEADHGAQEEWKKILRTHCRN
jgi:hypothetical protein